MAENNELIVGIDLGTTNSAVALYANGQIRVLDNLEGDRITPSSVFVTEGDKIIVGKFAKMMADTNKPEYGIEEIKRLIGRGYNDKRVQENMKHLSYTIEEESNEPIVIIQRPNGTVYTTPIEICSSILLKIRQDIEIKIGKKDYLKAVITVPAHFSLQQREATLQAAVSAGFHVLKLLNEPTAAAYKYIFEKKKRIKNNDLFLVYDFGGGTFDVAILKKTEENIETVAVGGDSFLGGRDLDNLIFNHVCAVLREKYNFNSNLDKKMQRRLQKKCEDAKIRLSHFKQCKITLKGVIPEGDQWEIKITRAEFEEIANDLFVKTINIVDNCLKDSIIPKHNIKEVILCGGSTKIPKIQMLLSNYFGKKVINKSLQPDECVAEGAAIQAAMLSKHPEQAISMIKVIDVTPLSIGIGSFASKMCVVIERGTPIPCSKTVRCNKLVEQTSCFFGIYEGERTDCRKNFYLGELHLENLTPAPPQQCEILVTLTINDNGILTLLAEEQSKDNTEQLIVVYTKGAISDADVKNSLKNAKDNEEEDKDFARFARDKEYLVNYCQSITYNIEKHDLIEEYKDLYFFWNNLHVFVEMLELDSKDLLMELINDTKSVCEDLVKKYNFCFMPESI